MLGLLVGYLFGFIGSVPLAGPIAVMVLRQALLGDYRKAKLITIGAATAEGLYAGLSLLGLDVLVKQYPVTVEYIQAGAGVLFIILGIFLLRSKKMNLGVVYTQHKQSKGFKRYLMLGFSVSVLNPVLLVTWAAAIAMFYSLTGIRFSLLDSLLFPITVAIGITTWFFILIALVGKYKEKFSIRLTSMLVLIMSGLLIVVGLVILGQRLLASL